ncbi:hypothetical protein SUGI_0697060 [Cryptomeria japonica]|nr:hypothetical protein SUGI_0697060 [Cryptomeria japonica]
MATERGQHNEGIDRDAYNAAVFPGTKIERCKLVAALNSTAPGSRNTLLHVAASVGNLPFIEKLLQLNRDLLKTTNAQGNTALHLAAQGGFCSVVQVLLQQQQNGVNVRNKLGETPLFKAYENGNIDTVKVLCCAYQPSIRQKTVRGQTCLYVAINKGDADLVKHVLNSVDGKELIQEKYEDGDTALHVATRRSYLHIMSQLIKFQPELCYWVNDNEETPLYMAVKLGHLEAVKMLVKERPDAVEIRNCCGMNVLHLAVQFSQMRIADYLREVVGLSELVNQGLESGDTPLHIAAKNKSIRMVESLLQIQGINKDAVNKKGLTALDIARENTEYHECHNMIAKLANYPLKRRHFLYTFPNVSPQKYENAIMLANKAYEDRRNAELVVAVLLATMSFTAAFTIPGGFKTELEKGETEKMLGSPLLIGLVSFKAFLIFDCLAFFLSLFVVLMWHLSTPLTTGNKVMFLFVTNILVCSSFGFTAFAFVATVYTMLVHKINTLAFFVLGFCTVICCCGFLLLLCVNIKSAIKMARFNHLHGVTPLVADRMIECLWMKLERLGFLTGCARRKTKYSNCSRKGRANLNSGCMENVQIEPRNHVIVGLDQRKGIEHSCQW